MQPQCAVHTAAARLFIAAQTESIMRIRKAPCFMCAATFLNAMPMSEFTPAPISRSAVWQITSFVLFAEQLIITSKQDAYQWLADLVMAPMSEAHIGHLGEYYCKLVIEESRKLLDRSRKMKSSPRFQVLQGGAAAS